MRIQRNTLEKFVFALFTWVICLFSGVFLYAETPSDSLQVSTPNVIFVGKDAILTDTQSAIFIQEYKETPPTSKTVAFTQSTDKILKERLRNASQHPKNKISKKSQKLLPNAVKKIIGKQFYGLPISSSDLFLLASKEATTGLPQFQYSKFIVSERLFDWSIPVLFVETHHELLQNQTFSNLPESYSGRAPPVV